jgi:uncharacterized membrane protein YGL010W
VNRLIEQLSKYSSYHRDPRNIGTHFIGIPMILVAASALLSRPALFGTGVTPAWFALVGAAIFYLRLDLRFGLVMSVLLGASAAIGSWIAGLGTLVWLSASLGMFGLGWVIQFLGHYFEGRKPAFVDDLVGLLVGPLFVVAEFGFALGLRREVKAEIERISGPVRRRRGGAPSGITEASAG